MSGVSRVLVRGALGDFRRTWPQLLLTDLLARGLGVVVLTPLVGLLFKLFLTRADDGVLADADIAMFLLHPIGLAGAVLVGALSLGILFAEQGTLMVIGFGAMEDRRVTWLDAVRYVSRYGRQLVALAGRFLLRVGLIATPFLAAIYGLYLLFLRQHDINFYLATHPPELLTALALAALLLGILGVIVLRVIAGAIVAVPLVLFEGRRGWDAMSASGRLVSDRSWRLAGQIAAWLLGFAVVSWAISLVIGLAGSLLIPGAEASLWGYALGLMATLLLMGLGQLLAAILGTAMFPLLVVRLYRRVGGTGWLDPAFVEPGPLGQRARVTVPGKWLLVGAAAALLVVAGGGYAVSRSLDAEQVVAVIAHRGASGGAPENTMAAFELAIEEQADWIELDVQEDADGLVIVAHDSDFMKTAGSGLKVWESTAGNLAELDIGSWFDPAFADQRVVTLREVLETARGHVGVVIELKYYGHDDRLEDRVVEIVEADRDAGRHHADVAEATGAREGRPLAPELDPRPPQHRQCRRLDPARSRFPGPQCQGGLRADDPARAPEGHESFRVDDQRSGADVGHAQPWGGRSHHRPTRRRPPRHGVSRHAGPGRTTAGLGRRRDRSPARSRRVVGPRRRLRAGPIRCSEGRWSGWRSDWRDRCWARSGGPSSRKATADTTKPWSMVFETPLRRDSMIQQWISRACS